MDETPQALADGDYDVLILDCEKISPDRARVSLVVVSGTSKGAVTSIVGPLPRIAGDVSSGARSGVSDDADDGDGADPTALMGLPGRLRVEHVAAFAPPRALTSPERRPDPGEGIAAPAGS
ncbi:MAG TPA: hypothetical protein VE990_01740 [Acidimicrobiales bacterium]|nr:hypothetical protein [Acidimicrobiales bacterium]